MKINGTDSMNGSHCRSLLELSLMAVSILAVANAQKPNTSAPEQPTTLSPKVVNIWPGVAPGSEQWKENESTLDATAQITVSENY